MSTLAKAWILGVLVAPRPPAPTARGTSLADQRFRADLVPTRAEHAYRVRTLRRPARRSQRDWPGALAESRRRMPVSSALPQAWDCRPNRRIAPEAASPPS